MIADGLENALFFDPMFILCENHDEKVGHCYLMMIDSTFLLRHTYLL